MPPTPRPTQKISTSAHILVVLLGIAAARCAGPAVANRGWLEARSANFSLYTTLDEARARELLEHLELFRAVILTVTRRAPGQAAFAIPLTLVMIHFAGIPFSGASVNPARSLAPALVGGTLDWTILVWIAGPLIGAAVGWAVYRALDDGSPAA